MTRTSVYEYAGGEDAFQALAAAHHQRCLDDPVLEHPFSHPGHPQHVQRLGWYWAEVFGGPPRYSQAGGTESDMLRMHAGNGMQADMGERFLNCFVAAADDVRLPDDAEFRTVLRSYMTWAVGGVEELNPPGSTVADGRAIPRWSWEGLVSG
jgi:hemoglobin